MNLSLNSSQTIAVVAVAGVLLAGAYAVGRSSGGSASPAAPTGPVAVTVPEAAKPEPVPEPAPVQKAELPVEAPATATAPKPVVKPAPPAPKPAAKPAVQEPSVAEVKPAVIAPEVLSKPEPVKLAKPALCAECLRVIAVRSEERQGEGSGLGVIGGAVIGGLLGSQVGGGSGKKLATIGGAVAGGYAGNEIEKRHKTQRVWIVKLEREDGRTLSHEQASDPGLVVGDVAVMREGELRRY